MSQEQEPIYGIPDDWISHDDVMVVQNSTPWTRKNPVYKELAAKGIDGRGVVGINLDTGYTRHDALPEPLAARNFTGGSSSDVRDRHGHGNHTIGSMCGRRGLSAAPGADFKVGKVLSDSGSGSNTVAGLDWAAEQEGDIVSCSWGGGGTVGSSTTRALQRIEESGKWCLFAAGNASYRGRDTVIAPGRSPHCIAVASIQENGSPSSFSSGGPSVDAAAGGSHIISCGIRNNLAVMSGTSMACPTLASDLKLLRQVMKMLGMTVYLDSRGLVKFLKSEEFLKDAGPAGRDARYGEGVIVSSEMILKWIVAKRPEAA